MQTQFWAFKQNVLENALMGEDFLPTTFTENWGFWLVTSDCAPIAYQAKITLLLTLLTGLSTCLHINVVTSQLNWGTKVSEHITKHKVKRLTCHHIDLHPSIVVSERIEKKASDYIWQTLFEASKHLKICLDCPNTLLRQCILNS